MTAPICIPVNSVQGFPFFHILNNICHLWFYWWLAAFPSPFQASLIFRKRERVSEREKGRNRETSVWESNTNKLPPARTPTRTFHVLGDASANWVTPARAGCFFILKPWKVHFLLRKKTTVQERPQGSLDHRKVLVRTFVVILLRFRKVLMCWWIERSPNYPVTGNKTLIWSQISDTPRKACKRRKIPIQLLPGAL